MLEVLEGVLGGGQFGDLGGGLGGIDSGSIGHYLFILCFCLLAKRFPGFVYGVLSAVVLLVLVLLLVPALLLFIPVLLLVLVLLALPFLEFLPACLAFDLCGRCLPACLWLVFAVLSSLLLLALPLASIFRILCSWCSLHLSLLSADALPCWVSRSA